MTRIEDGGPAFPRPASEFTKSGTCPDGNDPIDPQDGMALRDYFAAAALQGYCSSFFEMGIECRPASSDLARFAYLDADAMIAARKPK